MKKTELIKAAKELNKELGLDPEIEVKKVETEYLIRKLKEAAGMAVKEEDDLSDETWAVLGVMKETVDPPAAGESADTEKETTNTTKTTNTAKDLPAILAETKKLADLKALVEDNDEFKKLRKGLDKYKGLQGPRELRPEMEKCLGGKPAEKKTLAKPVMGKKKEKTASYKRPQAVADALLNHVGKTVATKQLIEEADALYSKANGKEPNLKQCLGYVERLITALAHMGFVTVKEGNVEIKSSLKL